MAAVPGGSRPAPEGDGYRQGVGGLGSAKADLDGVAARVVEPGGLAGAKGIEQPPQRVALKALVGIRGIGLQKDNPLRHRGPRSSHAAQDTVT
jgi:hypothetical protein